VQLSIFYLVINNNGKIYNGRVRGDGKEEVKEKGKTNRQVGENETGNQSRKLQRYKQGALVY
jgi:hypothetical protein